MTPADKVLENRLRRTLARRGYTLVKSRMRDPKGIGHGGYMIMDYRPNTIAQALGVEGVAVGGEDEAGNQFQMSLEMVQRWTDGEDQP